MSETNANVLRLEHITMQFGGVVAVSDFSMEVNKGEIVALIGPNGAGKTTAFNVITGVYEPTNGIVYFNGEPIVENYPRGKMKKLYLGDQTAVYDKVISKTPDKITKLGIARTFQNIRLFKKMTVFENVLIARHMRSRANFMSATFRLRTSSCASSSLALARKGSICWSNIACIRASVSATAFRTALSMRPLIHPGSEGAWVCSGAS